MWQDKVKEVIEILENSNINEIEVTFWGKKIRVVKSASNVISSTSSSSDLNEIKGPIANEKNDKPLNAEDTTGEKVLSPMPGVFYSAQSPDKPPFVIEGDQVKTGQTLCIIESMKIMNEIESEQSGTIKKILVNNSDPVEFNQPLFIIE
tara:strand:- start:219 stop:665 length:447 start_codon:yes stop_codon:yes gene_type:complete